VYGFVNTFRFLDFHEAGLRDRLDTGQRVLDAMVQLADEEMLRLLRLFALQQVRGLTGQDVEQFQFMVGRTARCPVVRRKHPQHLARPARSNSLGNSSAGIPVPVCARRSPART